MPEFKTLFDNFRETFLDVASPMNLAGLDSSPSRCVAAAIMQKNNRNRADGSELLRAVL